jgi:hypothetical protein
MLAGRGWTAVCGNGSDLTRLTVAGRDRFNRSTPAVVGASWVGTEERKS